MNRKPTALKVLEGNRGKRPLPEDEPRPRVVKAKAPKDLPKPAKRVFKKLSARLLHCGLHTELDDDALATISQLIAERDAVWKLIEGPPKAKFILEIIRPGKWGDIIEEKINPLYVLERQINEQLKKWLPEQGMTPRGRAGLSIGTAKDNNGEDLLT